MTTPKCKHCNNEAELKGYRDNGGVVSSEITCRSCFSLSSKVLALKTRLHLLEEGQEYWVIETVNGITHLTNSCKDDECEKINNKDIFKTFDDAIEYLFAIGNKDIRISNFRTSKIFDIKIVNSL